MRATTTQPQRSSAVEVVRKRKRGQSSLSRWEQRAEQLAAEEAAAYAKRKKTQPAKKPARKRPEKKQPEKKQPAKKQPANKKPANKQPANKQPAKKQREIVGRKEMKQPYSGAFTVNFDCTFEKQPDLDNWAGWRVHPRPSTPLGLEASLESEHITESNWKTATIASPQEKFTFILNRRGFDDDEELITCDMFISRDRADGVRQTMDYDEGLSFDLRYEEFMRNRPGNERKWFLSSCGYFGPGWVSFEVELLRGDKKIKVRVLKAGLVGWPDNPDILWN